MKPGEIQEELQYRIDSDRAHFGGTLPSRNALAWRAYLLGLLEWSVIDRGSFDRLASLLLEVEKDGMTVPAPRHPHPPPEAIVQELEARIRSDIASSGSRPSEAKVIFWRAYVSGLLERFVIYAGFQRLMDLLPPLDDDPARAILTGRPPPGR